jgi:predicted permease
VKHPPETLRKLVHTPLFTIAAILTLGLGLGANTAVFGVVNGVLLQPLTFPAPDRLVGVWHTAPGLGFDTVNQSPATYFTYREDAQAFEDIGLWDNTSVTVTGLAIPERVTAIEVTDGTLTVLGVTTLLGRLFSKGDDTPGTPETVILSYGFWQSRFGGAPDAIGRTLTVEGTPREIVGVMRADLQFLAYAPSLYLPLRLDRAKAKMGNFSYQGVARLRPGVTIAQANEDLARLIPIAVDRFPGGIERSMIDQARFGPKVRPLEEDVVGDVGRVLWVLLATVVLVLLVACANVANLFLVQAEARQVEIAVRTALGASRVAIARSVLSESMTLGLLGGILGLGLAYAGLRTLKAVGPESLPRLGEIGIDWHVVLFALLLSTLAGVVFGLIAVARLGRGDFGTVLKEGGRGADASRGRHRVRHALVVSQVAVALVLLVGAGLMMRTFQALRHVHPGFERPESVLTLRLSIPEAAVHEPAQVLQTHERIADALKAIAGVTSVGMSSSITMDGQDNNEPVFVEDAPTPEGQLPPIRRFKMVAPGYFETMGSAVRAGRTMTWSDIHRRAPVVLLTENLAREYWGHPGAAIGKRVRPDADGPWYEVIGVVGDERDDGVEQAPPMVAYWPMAVGKLYDEENFVRRSMAYAIRTTRLHDPGFEADVRRAVWSVDANLPLANVRTLAELLNTSMARTSFAMAMLGIAAVVALLLGGIGVYSVISYTVTLRTRELGVRMALGAQQSDVSWLVLRKGLVLAAVGVAIGLAASAGLTGLMSALLHGVSPLDPLTFGLVALILTGVALVASYLPARRAASIDPIEALRRE